MYESNEFFITLLSNDSMQQYRRNTLTQFTNYLEAPLDLRAQHWKVGISEIFYNPFVAGHFAKETDHVSGEHNNPNIYAECTQVVEMDGTVKETCERVNGPPLMDFFYIHCDIIKLRLVGSKCAKVLKVFPAKSNPEQYFRFNNIEYAPLHDDFIRRISIKITNQEGEKIKFVNSELPTMVTLHFKKIVYKE